MRVGGRSLFLLLNTTLLVANMGSGIAAQFGAARLLYAMGRGNSLPRRFFGALDPKTAVPRNNVLLIGLLTLGGVFMLTYQSGAELLNFGAFIAFMGVNAAAFVHYKFRSQEKVFLPATIPLCGLLVSGFIWLHLSHASQLLGVTWIALGLLAYLFMRNYRRNAGIPVDASLPGLED
jgi:putrescine importer